ncbi:MAG TPA: phasin family protein [Stellaceae bacterium]|nr:phasin family protein [Stellaceae bacterium]
MASKSKKSVVAALAVGKSEKVTEARPAARYAPLDLESLVDLGRENIAALAQANLALSAGMQALGQELLTYARSSFESASQAAGALFEAKTLDELIRLNSDLARSSFETLCAHSAKLSGMGVSIASETLAPLGGRVEAAFARLAKPAAA